MPTVPYTDPWDASFVDRLKALLGDGTKVAYLYEAPAKNTFRYRVYNMVQALSHCEGGEISASFFSTKELEQLSASLDAIDTIVISRARYTGELNQFITRARNKAKKVFFDVDDLIFDPDLTHLIVDSLDLPRTEETWNHWFAFVSRMRASILLCDSIITTNQFLADRLFDYFGKPTFVIPNFMNEQQLEISQQILARKKESNWKRNESITLGYFSGTQTHNKDFEVAATSLAALLKGDDRIKLRVGGHLSISEPIQPYASRIEVLPMRDFVNLQSAVGEVDLNLVPLQENVFSNCKSELKYFEAAIVGTLTIASPIYSYAKAIRDGQNGFLANSVEWTDKLEQAIGKLGSYGDLAENALIDARSRYTWSAQLDAIKQTLSA